MKHFGDAINFAANASNFAPNVSNLGFQKVHAFGNEAWLHRKLFQDLDVRYFPTVRLTHAGWCLLLFCIMLRDKESR